MKLPLQIASWIAIVIGLLAVVGGFGTTAEGTFAIVDGYAVIGGALFLTQGALSLLYITESEKTPQPWE